MQVQQRRAEARAQEVQAAVKGSPVELAPVSAVERWLPVTWTHWGQPGGIVNLVNFGLLMDT